MAPEKKNGLVIVQSESDVIKPTLFSMHYKDSTQLLTLRPSSDAVLHMSRIEL